MTAAFNPAVLLERHRWLEELLGPEEYRRVSPEVIEQMRAAIEAHDPLLPASCAVTAAVERGADGPGIWAAFQQAAGRG